MLLHGWLRLIGGARWGGVQVGGLRMGSAPTATMSATVSATDSFRSRTAWALPSPGFAMTKLR